jgi:tetratricopeptide (TPR) repeat protein
VKQRSLAVMLVVAGAVFLAGCGKEPRWTTTSPAAIPWLEKGVQHWQRFLYTEAFAAIDSAIAKDSTFAAAWGRRALLLYATNRLPEARSTIARATALAAHATPREQHLIRLWSCRINDLRSEEASLADSLIALYPEDPELYLIRGQCYENEREYEAAARMYSQSVERDTGFTLGVMSLGYSCSILGEQDRAVEYMQRYIRMAPDQPDPRASYADILVRAGRYDEALEQYRAALTIKSDYWYAVREIGTVYLIKGRLRDAERQFENAVRMLPTSMATEAALLRSRGAVDLQRGKFDAALALFQAAQAIDSSYLNQSYPMALSLSKLGRFAEAQELIDSTHAEIVRRQLTGAPFMEIYHLMRARVFTEEGKLDSAEAACRDAMENATPLTRGRVYVHLARVYRAGRKWDAALDAIESALAVTPDAPEALLTLTMVYAGTGDVAMAKEIGRRLMDLWRDADPDFRPLLELKQTLSTAVPHAV